MAALFFIETKLTYGALSGELVLGLNKSDQS